MNKIKNFIVENKFLNLFVLLQFIVTLINDKVIFSYDKPAFDYLYPYDLNYYEYIIIYTIIKILVLIFLFLFWKQIFKMFKFKDTKIKYFTESFLIVSISFLIFLIFRWPGAFFGDCFHLFEYSRHLQLIPWHSIFTSLFYIFSLSIIPIPSGIVIIQIIIFSFIYSDLYNIISTNLKNKKLRFLFLLPLFLPFIANNIIYPFRTTYYFFVELYYYVYVFLVLTRKTIPKNLNYIILVILSAFLVKYRSEGIVYLISFPIVFYFILEKNFKEKYFKYMILFISLIVLIGIPQNYFYNKYYYKEYLLANFYHPLSDIFNNREINEKEINDLINVNELKNYGGHYFFENNYLVTKHGTISSMNNKEQEKFINEMIKIFVNNFDFYIKSKINTFYMTLGYNPILPNHYRSNYFFTEQFDNAVANFYSFPLTEHNRFYKIINISYKCKDIIIITSLTIIYIFYSIIKKKYLHFVLCGTILVKTVIVFLASPSDFSPYYLGFYAIFYFLLAYLLIDFVDKIKIKGGAF